ncbi:MAG: hypothetical protein CMJ49_09865 [Planctomycetaceae bacterium]|nr:hypothetical protein [Planctomycetaceae bacterium]
MLRFLAYENGQPATEWPVRHAHLLGPDDIGIRASIQYLDGAVQCEKRAIGPASLALQINLPEAGELILQTCLLPDRDEPYLLMLELARHRLMKIIAKQEEWMMSDLPDDHTVSRRVALSKQRFIDALLHQDDPPAADKLARQSLILSIDASEELAMAHAASLLERRRQIGQSGRNIFLGTGIELDHHVEEIRQSLQANFDYLSLPMRWRQIEPREGEYIWQGLDSWAEWAFRNRLPIMAGPLVSFDPAILPDWTYIWEHDYEPIRDLVYEHVERVVSRYRNVVTLWNVVSGIHVNAQFDFSFDQLMDLTRAAIMVAKKVQPNARTLIEIAQPFGEYYAANQRSIPPAMYAELAIQSGIPFDGFGIKLIMGHDRDGRSTRDLMQISSLFDQFNGFDKPLHLTAVAVPSHPADQRPAVDVAPDPPAENADGGHWRKHWSPNVQAHWLEAFYNIALSKPQVESIAWADLTDHPDAELPNGGLLTQSLQPKDAMRRLATFRQDLHGPT